MSKTAVQRLKHELSRLLKEPLPNIFALPNPNNILSWHYVLFGPVNTPYEGGEYHGKVIFPSDYPYKPPSILMITPNGRFKPNTRLCLSMSDFHPETWNPLWSVASILNGLLSFMLEDTPTTGSITSTLEEKRQFAAASVAFNCSDPTFHKVFGEVIEEERQKRRVLWEAERKRQAESKLLPSLGGGQGNNESKPTTSPTTTPNEALPAPPTPSASASTTAATSSDGTTAATGDDPAASSKKKKKRKKKKNKKKKTQQQQEQQEATIENADFPAGEANPSPSATESDAEVAATSVTTESKDA